MDAFGVSKAKCDCDECAKGKACQDCEKCSKGKVSKSRTKDAVESAAGGAAGAAAGGGTLAAGRVVYNSQNRPSKTAVNYGKVAIPIDSKGTATMPKAQTSLERAVWSGHNLGEARSLSDKAAGAVFRPGLGRIQRMSRGKKAAIVLAPAAVTAAAVGGAKKIRDRRVSTGA